MRTFVQICPLAIIDLLLSEKKYPFYNYTHQKISNQLILGYCPLVIRLWSQIEQHAIII